MKTIATHKVPKQQKPIRLQEYAVGIFNILPTKSGIKKAIKKELILVDGKTTSTGQFIQGGEIIELQQAQETSGYKQFDLKLEVVYEDTYLAIVYKPGGV